MKQLCLIATVLAASLAAPLSADVVEGVLLDNVCLAEMESPAYDAALEQSKNCDLLRNGKKKGFSIVEADGAVKRLDPKGSTLALRAVDASGKTSEVKVEVEGKVKGDRLVVDTLLLKG